MQNTRLEKGMICLGVIFAAIVSAYLLVNVLDLGLINNGDGGRVLRSAFVLWDDTSAQVHLPLSFPMQPISAEKLTQVVPLSPAAMLAMSIALTCKLSGSSRFPMIALTSIYFAIFYAGCFLLIGSMKRLPSKIIAATVCLVALLDPYLVSYFFSVYEEALIIALTPMWCYLALSAFRYEKMVYPFFVVTLVIVASKSGMIVVLVASVIFCLKYQRFYYLLGTTLIFVASFLSLAKSDALYSRPNSFNRLYNGLAYSLSNVSQWPTRSFVDRRSRASTLVRADEFFPTGLPGFALSKWGHSYWPDTYTDPESDMTAYVALGDQKSYLTFLVVHPHLGLKLVEEAAKTAVVSDYTLSYIDQPRASVISEYRAVFQEAHQRLGLLFLVALPMLALGIYGPCPAAVALLLIAIVSPVVVVLGDGYFEFEKHLFPFLILIWFSIPVVGSGLISPSRTGIRFSRTRRF